MGPASGGANVAGYFHKIFGESPVLPIQEHCSLCYQAVDAMLDMLRHAAAGDWVKAEEGRARVVGFELRADRLKWEVRGKLPAGCSCPWPARIFSNPLSSRTKSPIAHATYRAWYSVEK